MSQSFPVKKGAWVDWATQSESRILAPRLNTRCCHYCEFKMARRMTRFFVHEIAKSLALCHFIEMIKLRQSAHQLNASILLHRRQGALKAIQQGKLSLWAPVKQKKESG